jgi:hypothetical protein
VAQLGARFHGMEEVVGSIPTRSTKFSTTCRYSAFQFGVIWRHTALDRFPFHGRVVGESD